LKIKAAAMIYKGEMYIGRRHDLIIASIALDKNNKWPIMGLQGFVTDKETFVNRNEAYNIAERENQLISTRKDRILFSEYTKMGE
jgi:hypothetical protein